MLKCWISCMAIILCVTGSVAAQGNFDAYAKKYIRQYHDLAMAEQRRKGIPAAITLAQGIHETSGGQSELMVNANNHFGIKCKKNWTGETYTYTDDAPDECFRKYGSAEASYKDHSDYLASSPRYAALFKLSQTDYAAWAMGLRQAGYATNPKYAKLLIRLIEDYHLQEYTYAALEDNNFPGEHVAETSTNTAEQVDKPQHVAEVIPEQDAPAIPQQAMAAAPEVTTPNRSGHIKVNEPPVQAAAEPATPEIPVQTGTTPPAYGTVVKINGLKAVYAKKGDMPLEYAISQNVRYERLLEINEIGDRPLSSDMYLYLERKRFKGMSKTHVVKAGETIAKIAQYESMQQRYIRAFNHLADSEEPAAGSVLYLQEDAPGKPALVTDAVGATPEPVAVAENMLNATAAPQETVPTQPVPAETTIQQPQTDAPVNAAVTEQPVAAQEPQAQFAVLRDTISTEQPVNNEIAKSDIGPAKPEVATPASQTTEPTDPKSIANLPPPPPPPPAAETTAAAPAVNEAVVTDAINPPVDVISKTPKKEAKDNQPQQQNEPMDELDALKAKFDKVVYAPHPAEPPVTTEPATAKEPEQPATNTEIHTPPVASASKIHAVKKGDTAFNIAKRYNMTVKELMEWNNLDMGGIKIGQKLKVKQ